MSQETTERKPLLSDRDLEVMSFAGDFFTKVRDFYESKITSGELRVVKKVATSRIGQHTFCDYCGTCVDPHPDFANRPPNPLCPGCGAMIDPIR